MKNPLLGLMVFGLAIAPLSAFAFNDVETTNPNLPVYQHLRDIGIMNAQYGNTFQGSRTVSRAEALAAVLKSAGVWSSTEAEGTAFNDVVDAWQVPFINAAMERGIINASHPSFYPNQAVSKAQLMQWIVDAHGINTWAYQDQLHTLSDDVPADSPYARAFAYAKTYHIVHLHPDNTFGLMDSVNRHEMAMYLYRNREVIHGDWSSKQYLRLGALIENFLSAVRGEQYLTAEKYARDMQAYTARLLTYQNDETAFAAEALTKSVEHFTDAVINFSQNRRTKGFASLMLAEKQAVRAQEVSSEFKDFAQQIQAIIAETTLAFASVTATK